jgi:hypothetical protein
MAKQIKSVSFSPSAKVKRPNVHSKKKTSGLKTSKNYVKPYRGQG